ncbi:MAG: ferrous iron transport protein B [Salibacteraceae bacterium]
MGTKEEFLKIALIGNPNAGKTSVFNRLTGLNQTVGNFPGVTVDKKSGTYSLPNNQKAVITDLPGTYSLYPNSSDERIVLDTLLDEKGNSYPDLVLYVADANNLERHLVLLTQIMDFGVPIILLLNMIDVANSEGKSCNTSQLSSKLGIPVVPVNGRTGEGTKDIGPVILQMEGVNCEPFLNVEPFAFEIEKEVKDLFGFENNYRALLTAHNYKNLNFISVDDKNALDQIVAIYPFNSVGLQFDEIMARYDRLHPIMESMVEYTGDNAETKTAKADKILTHPFWGSLIFLSTLFVIFQAIFAWASFPMDLIDSGMSWVIDSTKSALPQGLLSDFITDGILAGIGGIIIFIPQITILFILVSLLEEVGYMARAVFLSDNLMRKFGLNGRSIVSLISGAACAVPAIMATRTISNWKERLITIFVTPFISCSARIPVFAVLVAFAVPNETVGGLFNLQGLVMMGLYSLGVIAALGSAWVMKLILKSKDHSFLMMELPTYKMPYWKNIGITVFQKVGVFITNAGKIILIISMILWVLASFGPGNSLNVIEETTRTENASLPSGELDNLVASKKIEGSYAGILGKEIEPIIRPLGFDWKIGIALITSFAAREVFISTMATIYSVGSDGDAESVMEKMRLEKNPNTGLPVYTSATAFSLLIFYVLAMQCMSTLAIVKRETNSWSIPMAQLIYMTGLAYLLSYITYQLLS